MWLALANHHAALALLLAESGNGPGSMASLRDGHTALDRAILDHPDDFLARRDRVMFLLLQGNFESSLASTAVAAATFEQATQTATRLLEIDPGNVNLRYDLGNAHGWLGRMLARMGKTEEARTHFRQQVEVFQVLVRQDPANLGLREGLHSAQLSLEDSLADENRYAEAEPAYLAALLESEQLVALSRQSPSMLREQAFSCGRLAETGLNTNRPREALDWARQSVALHEKTVSVEPRNPEYLLSLSLALGIQGQIERHLRREGGASEELPSWQRAYELGDRALLLQPTARDAMSFLAGHAQSLRQCLIELGETAHARKVLGRGHALLEQLVAADPTVVRYRRSLALILSLLTEAETPGTPQSCRALQQARELAEALGKENQGTNNPLLAEDRFARLSAACAQP